MKKVLATILALVMAIGLCSVSWADEAKVAKIGGTEYDTLQAAVDAATAGQTIVLLKDVDASSGVTVGKKIVLDMNGKKLYNTVDIWDTSWSLISVQANGDLTITGNGTFAAKENDCYAVDVQDGGKVTIQNGTFIGNIHAVYVYIGTAIINGGTYTVQQQYPNADRPYDFVLNCYDASRADGTAKITVNGGEFPQIDPSNCKAEGEGTDFVAAGVAVATVVDGDNTSYAVGSAVIAAAANSGKSVTVTKTGPVTGVDAGKSIAVADGVTGVTVNGVTVTGDSYTVPQPPRYYYNSTTTTTDTKATDTKGSPKTFDAGIALYVGMALTSAAGVAFVGKKRED
ncbi:MAG: hypothetical protein U0M81_04660 [Oscillospiraceae bacterium]